MELARTDRRRQLWLSAHIHFEGLLYGSQGDDEIAGIVGPLVDRGRREQWLSSFFFIRYAESGPHIRLRMFGEEASLLEQAVPAVESAATGRVRWVAYEPETSRYGGEHALALAERFFEASSTTVLLWLASGSQERSQRLGQGLLLMTVLCFVFCRNREIAIQFLNAYEESYLRASRYDSGPDADLPVAFRKGYERQNVHLSEAVEQTWELLEGGESISPLVDSYRRAAGRLFDGLAALAQEGKVFVGGAPSPGMGLVRVGIAPSFAHMTNNRMGISVIEEAYLAHLLKRALSRNPEQV